MTNIIIRKGTVKGVILGVLAGLTIILGPWLNKIIYSEKEIIINMKKDKYLKIREKYRNINVEWKNVGQDEWRKSKYLFLFSSRLVKEEKEIIDIKDIPRELQPYNYSKK